MPRKRSTTNIPPGGQNRQDSAEDGRALAHKLGIKPEGMAITFLWAPDGFPKRLGLEDGNYDADLVMGKYDLILLFVASRVLLREYFPSIVNALESEGKVWVCLPRRSAREVSDLAFEDVQAQAQSFNLIEVNRCRFEAEPGSWHGVKFKKGVVPASNKNAAISSIAPYSISDTSTIPISQDAV